jgi:hypothetical protein
MEGGLVFYGETERVQVFSAKFGRVLRILLVVVRGAIAPLIFFIQRLRKFITRTGSTRHH